VYFEIYKHSMNHIGMKLQSDIIFMDIHAVVMVINLSFLLIISLALLLILLAFLYVMTYHSCCLLQTNMLLVKVNDTKSCFLPLVATKSEISWYPYVDGCGLQCDNVLFTEADHTHAHIFIAAAGSLCFFCTLFTVVSAIFVCIKFCILALFL